MDEDRLQSVQNRCKWRAQINNCDATRRWRYGNLITSVSGMYLCYKGKSVATVRVYEDTIGQFTGLKDKDGTEIYEGDILLDENDHPCVVVNRDYEWMLDYMGKIFWFMRDTVTCLCTVVGNKWDNPELIEKHK